MRGVFRLGAGVSAAALVNGSLFACLEAIGGFGPAVGAVSTGAPLSLAPVLGASAGGVVAATVVRLALALWLRRRQPARRVFFVLSGAVLLLSFLSPVHGLRGAGLLELLTLEVMHVVVALVGVVTAELVMRPAWTFGASPYPERTIQHRTALVTGATSGIGERVLLELAHRGYRVVGVGLSAAKAKDTERRAKSFAGQVTMLTGDMSLMREVVRLAELANTVVGPPGFSVVVHCAGTLKPRSAPTAEGIDENFSTSFLSRMCLLANLRLASDVRTVNVAAGERGLLPKRMRVETRTVTDIGSGMQAHGRAQLANDLWTARLLRSGSSVYGYGPGAVRTAIRRELPPAIVAAMAPFFWADIRRPEEAARDIVRLLLDADLPPGGFADREGLFEPDPFVRDPGRQDALVALGNGLIADALARSDRTREVVG